MTGQGGGEREGRIGGARSSPASITHVSCFVLHSQHKARVQGGRERGGQRERKGEERGMERAARQQAQGSSAKLPFLCFLCEKRKTAAKDGRRQLLHKLVCSKNGKDKTNGTITEKRWI